jgi:hypothetical protein
MGSSFVAQLARGTSGSGTVFVQSESEHLAAGARCGDALVWVAPDLGDLSLNINAVALESGVVVGYPSVQLVGLPMLGCRRGMYCGNDYAATADLPPECVHDVVEQTERLGRWLASLGFRGLFGLDYALDPSTGTAYAVDLNPRWQGSTGLLAQAEYSAGRLPLTVAELGCRLGLLAEREILRHKDDFLEPVSASHFSLRSARPGWSRVTGSIEPGIYSTSMQEGQLHTGVSLDELAGPDEVLIIGAVPRPNALIGSTAHILRVNCQRKVMDVARMAPLAWSETLAAKLYRAAGLADAEVE